MKWVLATTVCIAACGGSVVNIEAVLQSKQENLEKSKIDLPQPPASSKRNIFEFVNSQDIPNPWRNWRFVGTFVVDNQSMSVLLIDASNDTMLVSSETKIDDWWVSNISTNEITFTHSSGLRHVITNIKKGQQ